MGFGAEIDQHYFSMQISSIRGHPLCIRNQDPQDRFFDGLKTNRPSHFPFQFTIHLYGE